MSILRYLAVTLTLLALACTPQADRTSNDDPGSDAATGNAGGDAGGSGRGGDAAQPATDAQAVEVDATALDAGVDAATTDAAAVETDAAVDAAAVEADASVDAAAVDAEVVPLDAEVVPLDAEVVAIDAEVIRADAEVVPLDAEVIRADAEVVPLDADVVPLDAEVVPLDAEVIRADAEVIPVDAAVPDLDAMLPEPDAAIDAGADAVVDAAIDAEPLPPPEFAPLCQRRGAVTLYDGMFLSGDQGLLRARIDPDILAAPQLTFAWEAGWIPQAPVAKAADGGGAEVFVALNGPGCRIRAFDQDGAEAWTADLEGATSCTRPMVDDELLVVATSTVGGGRVVAMDKATGETLASAGMPTRATSAVMRITGDPTIQGEGNSGSHWVVGGDDFLYAFGRGPDAEGGGLTVERRASFGFQGAQVTEVVPADDDRLAVVLNTGVDGLGDFVQAVDVLRGDGLEVAFGLHGDRLETPDDILAPPVAAGDCAGDLQNSGALWWCPGRIVALGGEGWMWLFDLDTGLVRLADEPPGLRITGLALGYDGRIYTGGSVWQQDQSQWSLRAIDPDSAVVDELVGGVAPPDSCLGSPVIEGSGVVATQIDAPGAATALALASTQAGGLAPAWARLGGDNQGGGSLLDPFADCPGGEAPYYSRPVVAISDLQLQDFDSELVTFLADGSMLPTGTAEVDGAVLPWAARIGPFGYLRWLRFYEGIPGEDAPYRAGAADGDGAVLVRGDLNDQGERGVRLLRIDIDGNVELDVFLRNGIDRRPDTIAVLPDGYALTTVDSVQVPGVSSNRLLVTDRDGVVQADNLIQTGAQGELRVESIRVVGADTVAAVGVLSALATPPVAFVGVMDTQAVLSWFDLFQRNGMGTTLDALDLQSEGSLLTAGNGQTAMGDREAFVRLYGANGMLLAEDVLPGEQKVQEVAVTPRDDAFVLTERTQLIHITQFGAVGSALDYNVEGGVSLAFELALAPEGGLRVGGLILLPDGMSIAPWSIRADPWGRASCGGAGKCVSFGAADCDGRDPCAEDFCNPTEGACASIPLDDGSPCGPGLDCQAGLCQ